MSDECVSKAVARPSIRLPIIELSQARSSEAGSRYRIVERRHCRASEYKGAAADGRVGTERFRLSEPLSNASADDSLDAFAERHVTLILGLTCVEPDGAFFPIKLIQLHPQHFIKTSASEPKQHHRVSRIAPQSRTLFFARIKLVPRRRVEKNFDEGFVLPILNHTTLKLSLTCHFEFGP